MPLPRRVHARGSSVEPVLVNVIDINTKEIVFTGGQCAAAAFLGSNPGNIAAALRNKSRIKKQYAVRIAKQQQ